MEINNNVSPADRIISLKTRIQQANNTKIGAEKTLELLKKDYDARIVELQKYNITDVSKLPEIINDLSVKLNTLLQDAENNMAVIESKLAI